MSSVCCPQDIKITVAGGGYVGLSSACLFSADNDVVLFDIDEDKVRKINSRISPLKDEYIEKYFAGKELKLTATTNAEEAFPDADIVIVSVPTNYDEETGAFDTSAAEKVIEEISRYNSSAYIVIKSTVPVGFTDRMIRETGNKRIMFSPEFLRETKALYDCLHPSRVIVGTDLDDEEMLHAADTFIRIAGDAAEEETVKSLKMASREAETVKLFSNAYLAARVTFFNELDAFAESKGMDAASIISGVCLDERIGDYYNNPSFGYGGYCLPKDTKQLLAQFDGIPQKLMGSVVSGNTVRKEHIADCVLKKASGLREENGQGSGGAARIGVFRINMKQGSDNFRQSAVMDIIRILKEQGADVVIYEPLFPSGEIEGIAVEKDLASFKEECDVILANRYDDLLDDIKEKVYTRDIFRRD